MSPKSVSSMLSFFRKLQPSYCVDVLAVIKFYENQLVTTQVFCVNANA